MPRPQQKKRNKTFNASEHHAPKETHKIGQVTFAALAQIQEAIMQLNNAKANLLSKSAVDDWGYPTGIVLEFSPIDFKAGTVDVIMRGQVKDSPAATATDDDKE